MNNQTCVFCNATDNWPGEYIIGTLKSSIVLLSQDQYFKGWCLVVSNRHVIDLFELNEIERSALEKDVIAVSKGVQRFANPDRMNYAIFGNVVPHLHWNVIPRKRDDGLWGHPPWPHNEVVLETIDIKTMVDNLRSSIEGIAI
jgi:diadenosine tetraphosphate (Ap4A) HIT family hydrolase